MNVTLLRKLAFFLIVGHCLPSIACTNDDSVVGSYAHTLQPGKPLAILVHQNGSDLAVEVTDATSSVFYNQPNDRMGFEIILIDASSRAREVRFCIHSVFRNSGPSPAYTLEVVADFDGYSESDVSNLRLFSDAGRQWAQPDHASKERALGIYSSIAASRTDKLALSRWASLALTRGHIHLSQFSEASEILQEHDFETFFPEQKLKALAYYYLGLAQLRTNDVVQAITNLKHALLYSDNAFTAADIKNYLGEAELILGRLEEGKAHIQEALDESGNDHSLLAHIHNNVGFIRLRETYDGTRSAQEASALLRASIAEHELARAYAISARDSAELILIENNLGTLYERVGELRKANQHYRESLRLTEATNDRLGMSIIYRHLGIVSQHFGDYTKAQSYLEFAMEMANSESSAQRSMCLLGKNHIWTRQFDKALDALQQCYHFAVKQQDVSLEIQTLTELSEVNYLLSGQQPPLPEDFKEKNNEYFVNALAAIQQARALANTLTELSTPPSNALPSGNICTMGTDYFANISARSGSVRTEEASVLAIKVLSHYAVMAQLNGASKEALESLVLARSQLDTTRFLEEIEILDAAMTVYSDQKLFEYSEQCGNRAIELIETLHQQLAAEQNGAAWSAKTHAIYIRMAETLIQQSANRAGGVAAVGQAVLELAERSRAINLRQQLSMPKVDVTSFEIKQLQENIGRIAAENAAGSDAELAGYLPASFYQQRDLLELAKVANLSSVPVPAPSSLSDAQGRMLPTQSILYYLITDQQSYLFEINKNSLKLHVLGKTSDLHTMTQDISSALKSPGTFSFAGLQRLSEFLLPPNLELSNVDELIVVPHRGLDAVPFSALQLVNSGSTDPLIMRFALKMVPSLSTYFMPKPEIYSENRADIAIFANPVFSDRAISAELASNDLRSWSESLQPLPFTGVEARRLMESMNIEKALQYTGNRATLRNLTTAEVRSAKILHIATHGYFQSINSDNVGFALSAIDEDGQEVPNFVTLSELLGHSFSNELVVISGCDTAMGLQLEGEGMMGLPRGFISQGAKHVISTLWPVSDRASAEFMSSFYHHLRDQDDVAKALKLAQQDLARNSNYRNPYYWAGYVLTSVSPDSSLGL